MSSTLGSIASRLRPAVRRAISVDTEYRLRNALIRFLPVDYTSRWSSVIHATTWKAGSQWLRLLLSDPTVYRQSGLRVDPFGRLYGNTAGYIRSPIYATRPDVLSRVTDATTIWFFVTRDPRDILVSFYFSNLYNHDPNPSVMQRRRRLSLLSTEEGLISTIRYDFEESAAILRSWLPYYGTDEVFYFEYLIRPELDHWMSLLRRCDCNLSEEDLAQLLRRYSFENLSGGRRPGEEDPHHKYRSGKPGTWTKYMTTPVLEYFLEQYGDLLAGPYR